MAKTKYLTYGILILTVVGIILISGCTQEDSQTPKNIDCAREGEKNYFGEPSCCEGLVQIPNTFLDSTIERCIGPEDGSAYCTKCGDGICKSPENKCNCPQDCEEPSCVKEGESYMPGEEKNCCLSLEKMSVTQGDGERCTLPMGYVCTSLCGDGKCEGDYENPCSCPKDCPSAKKSITVTFPNGGEELEIGRMCVIIWDSGQGTSIGDKLNIYLVDESQDPICTENGRCCYKCTNWKLITTVANFGEYRWDIPSDQKTGNKYRIYLRTLSSDCFKGCADDQSDEYFSITEKKAHHCSDTDGGKDYYKKGTVTLRDVLSNKILEEKTDYCEGFDMAGMTDIMVVEHYCENNEIKSEMHDCPNKCKYGACIRETG